VGVIVVAALAIGGCSEQLNMLKARQAFKEANGAYAAKEYEVAIEKYNRVLELDPEGDPRVIVPAYFYLGSSHHLIYRPTRQDDAENDAHLEKAIELYEKSLDITEEGNPIRQYAYEQLGAIYRDVLDDFPVAEECYLALIDLDPERPERYYALGDLYERFDDPEELPLIEKAIEAYQQPVAMNPEDPVGYRHVAALLNKYGRFEETMQWQGRATDINPNDPEGYYIVATHYWDKVYRDPDLSTTQRKEFIVLGQEALDRALELNQQYVDALVYKNLLLREEAKLEPNARRRAELEGQANALRDQALEIKKAEDEAARAAASAEETS
jgi:tetratricopeptide (TPR) repeat protein